MDQRYICHCGLYCENCATKAKVEPAAKHLYEEMVAAGFEDVVAFLPDGELFWQFLKSMALEGACPSCKMGGGDPDCQVRLCAAEKKVELCALCEEYPCEKINSLLEGYPMLKADNELLRGQGRTVWEALQDERKAKGVTYSNQM